MSEIFLIIFQIFFIFALTFYSVPEIKLGKKLSLSLTDKLAINSLILINIFLVFSFINFNINHLFLFLIFISIFLIITKKNKLTTIVNYELIYIFLIIFLISITLASNLELGWDAKDFWFLKVLNFYQYENLYNLDKLPVTDYPHLGSFIWSFFWKFPFNQYEYLGRIYFIFFYIISIFSFFELLKINQIKKIILSTLTVIVTYSNELFSGNQEILLFSLILLSAKFSYIIFLNQKNVNNLNIIFLLLLIFNSAIWIKNEGIFFLSFVLFLILVLSNLKWKEKKILIIGTLFLVILRIFIFQFLNTSLESFEFDKTLSYKSIENVILNVKTIIFFSIVYLTQIPILALGLVLLIYNILSFKFDKIQIFIICFFLLNIAFIFGAFLLAMENVEWQVRVGLKRVMFESSGFYLLTLIYLLNKLQGKND